MMCSPTSAKRIRSHPAVAPLPSSGPASPPESLPKRRRLDVDTAVSTPPPRPKTPPLPLPESSCLATKTSTKRRVRFAPAAAVLVVPRRTPQEFEASWDSALDVAHFHLQAGTDAALLRQAFALEFLPQEVGMYRGLERQFSSQILSEIKERRRAVVRSVLLEQALQRRSGRAVADDLRIAEASRRYSEKAAVWALTLGSL